MAVDYGLCVGIAAIVLVGATLQSTVGFAFGLLVMPVLLFAGLSLPEAVVIVIICSAAQTAVALRKLRKAVDWRDLRPVIGMRLLLLPVGLWVMYEMTFLSRDHLKQVIGVCILLTLLARWVTRAEPRQTVARVWAYVAGSFSGLLNGMAGIGGPPIVLWILMHDWPNDKLRVTTVAVSLTTAPVQLALIWWQFSDQMPRAMLCALIGIPAAVVGSWLGLHIGARASRKWLRVAAQIILMIIAAVSIFKPYV